MSGRSPGRPVRSRAASGISSPTPWTTRTSRRMRCARPASPRCCSSRSSAPGRRRSPERRVGSPHERSRRADDAGSGAPRRRSRGRDRAGRLPRTAERPRRDGRAHGTTQPAFVGPHDPQGSRLRDENASPSLCGDHRPRPLQAVQRSPRPPGGRPAPQDQRPRHGARRCARRTRSHATAGRSSASCSRAARPRKPRSCSSGCAELTPEGQTCSVGLAEWSGESDADLVARADAALYEAKRAGRDALIVVV